ncbi:Histidine kinase [Flavobacterium sp. 9AF]|uniref:AraC family transcriptional regulator n=1 Tax=Flavobacterium sp. 9AF TaxID=2653142 RepID=UPI0012EF4960|nr:AraC family transcriptional regulator [Flavobacterium sp. 9AF]VXB41606.1 Histidine kinase [Flavobacterium sp. 9AF]
MKYVFTCIVFLFSLTGYTQEIQLLPDEYEKLQDELRIQTATNIDSAFAVAIKIGQSNNQIHKAFSKGAQAYLLKIKGDSIASIKQFEKAISLINSLPYSKEQVKTKAYILNYQGICDIQKGDLNAALLKLLEGEKLSISVGDIVQAVKFNTNIALINGEIGNYKTAINKAKYSEYLVEKNKNLYSSEQYKLNKSNIYLSLGRYYEYSFKQDYETNKSYLDSATYYYNKTILYSKNLITNKIKAQNNLANVYYHQENFEEAEKNYQNIVSESFEHGLTYDYAIGLYNLGNFYYWEKKYKRALTYFQKYDSLHVVHDIDKYNFVNSNYYQSKIYEFLNDYDNTLKHTEIYLKNFEKNEFKINEESVKINSIQNNLELKEEITLLQKRYQAKIFWRNVLYLSAGVIVFLLLVLLIRNSIEKKKSNAKYKSIIENFKNQLKQKEDFIQNVEKEILTYHDQEAVSSNMTINIDEQKEKEILNSLKNIEDKLIFLNQDFTLQYVAKKIKTNTTYLSYIVNKNFSKTFSEYANELKINYVVNEMITNSKYRKYSTQAIAESVGYKNATSFTRSFSKKTGLSPVQFAKKLEDEDFN